MINVHPPDHPPPPPRSLSNQGWENCSLRSERFRLVWEERNTEDFASLFSRSLTLVPRSFLLNGTETLATQATIFPSLIWEGVGGGGVLFHSISSKIVEESWGCLFEEGSLI